MRYTISIWFLAMASCLSVSAVAAESGFSGKYRVNGTDAKLNHMTVIPGGCFNDGIGLVFSERDVQIKPKGKLADVGFNVQMKNFGDAVAVLICARHDSWEVDHSNFNHSALKNAAGTWADQLKVEGMKVTNGEYSGRIVSIKDAAILGQPLEMDITFHAKAGSAEADH